MVNITKEIDFYAKDDAGRNCLFVITIKEDEVSVWVKDSNGNTVDTYRLPVTEFFDISDTLKVLSGL